MTYRELTEGIIRLWEENAKLMDVVALIDGYFLDVQQRSGGNEDFAKIEIEGTTRLLHYEASKLMREENQLDDFDRSLHDKIGIICFIIMSLLDRMREARIVSVAYWDDIRGSLEPIWDRQNEFYLEQLVGEKDRLERAKVARGRRSLNLKLKQEYAGKKEDKLVTAVLEFIGASKGMAEIKTMRCFLFVRKNKEDKDDGTEFYFLGQMRPTGQFRQTMPRFSSSVKLSMNQSNASPER